ncbi:WD40 repeat-like protein [Suillus weaverae]|nr:WD40 repeat-like protein [Suillus weaverae]
MSSSNAKMKETSVIMPRQTLRGHSNWVQGIVHLPDGRHIITCSSDGSLRLWDLESGTQTGNDWQDEGDEEAVFIIALSPNGNTVASGSSDGKVRLWDIKTGKVVAKWTGHTNYVWSVCWSADGGRVVSGSRDGTARVWDVASGETVLDLIETGHEWVWAIIYSPDKTKVATGGFNENVIKIWDANIGELLSTIKHDRTVLSLAWTSDGKKLISASFDGSIRVFDTATWHRIAILEGHQSTVKAISLSRNDRLLASVLFDKIGCLWNLDTNLPVGPPLQHEYSVECAAFSADGKLLVTGSRRDVYVWDIHAILKEAGHEDLLSIPVLDEPGQKIQAGKSLMDTDAAKHQSQPKGAHRLPRGFFDDPRDGDGVHSSTSNRHHSSARRSRDVTPSFGSLTRALLGRLSSLFSGSHGEVIQLQQQTISSPHDPHPVEVPAVRDKQTLYVAPRPRPACDKAKPAQQQQGQAQVLTPITQFATASPSTRPVLADSNTTSARVPGTPSQPAVIIENPTWRTRFFVFICCVTTYHTDGR